MKLYKICPQYKYFCRAEEKDEFCSICATKLNVNTKVVEKKLIIHTQNIVKAVAENIEKLRKKIKHNF